VISVTDLTMQDALSRLSSYWTGLGCLTVQPMNTEVGAGTLNPATALRVLGPEPWRVAYVEPSVRPDDARYGENPNRIQTHTQFQVVLKPEPGNPQELYLGSLAALGIDVTAHDVRFVEDNWASPALGAWGLGWEVWLDGLEITQFTYFQQAGGVALDPVSVEITYGVERILMALQDKRHFKDIVYAPGVTYGEVFGQAEYEMSRYYLDDADIPVNRSLLDAYAHEAQRMVDAGLAVPAHSFILKMSHVFNVLDARGAVSTADRAGEFARMRRLSNAVARLWIAGREKPGFPLGTVAPQQPVRPQPVSSGAAVSAGPRLLVFEIGVEEMPPSAARDARDQVERALTERLAAGRLTHGAVTVRATPRRITAFVRDVADHEPDTHRTVRGPRTPAQPAAAEGFARANGVPVEELSARTVDGAEYLYAKRHEPGRPAAEALASALSTVVTGLRSARNMRWNDPSLTFTRPIRWLLALLGDQVVPVAAGGLTADRLTRLHRDAATPVVEVASAEAYNRVVPYVLDPDERRAVIAASAEAAAATVGGRIDTGAEADLLDQITFLVEEPTAVLGGFEARYLELPDAVTTTVMRKQQRYLPVRSASGLLPHFVAIANGTMDPDVVRAGNEAVLRARFEDAAYFYRADLGTPMPAMRERLSSLTFTDKLGSMADRADRVGRLALVIGDSLHDADVLRQAVPLLRFDLGSQMVTEMTSLAGVMAREYALAAGLDPAVAEALYEAELPRQAGDVLPASTAGAMLAVSDKLDSLVGLAATVGLPTGSSDPFALRRAALGAIAILRTTLSGRSWTPFIEQAVALQPVPVDAQVVADLHGFLTRRLEQQLLDEGHGVDRVRATLVNADRPSRVDEDLRQLAELSDSEDFQRIAAALQRARRMGGRPDAYEPQSLTEPAEIRLHEAVSRVRLPDDPTLRDLVEAAGDLPDAVNAFFDDVLVMADDPGVRQRRLALVGRVAALARGLPLDPPPSGALSR
jgi:glycyl-tRNA synthetase